jgi:hypothetical protein
MKIEPKIDTAFYRMVAMDNSEVIDVLKRSYTSGIIRKVRVRRRRIQKGKRKRGIRMWCQETEEILAPSEDSFIGYCRSWRPTPIDG